MDIQEIIERTDHIPSSVYPPEQAMWLKYLKELSDGSIIVDFGTGWGKSAISLGLSCPQGRVLTFDTGTVYLMHHNVESYAEYGQKVTEYIQKSRVNNLRFIVHDSVGSDPQKFLSEQMGTFKIDMLNIDSDHTYETTLKEIKAWVPLVKKGGLITLHDWMHPMCPGVRQAWDELIAYDAKEIEMSEWKKHGGSEFEYDNTIKVSEKENHPEHPVAKVEFLELARSPIVTTALFKVL